MGLGGGGVARGGGGFGGPFKRLSRGFGGGALDEDVVVVGAEVALVVEVVELEVEVRALGDRRGSWAAGAGVGCLVL